MATIFDDNASSSSGEDQSDDQEILMQRDINIEKHNVSDLNEVQLMLNYCSDGLKIKKNMFLNNLYVLICIYTYSNVIKTSTAPIKQLWVRAYHCFNESFNNMNLSEYLREALFRYFNNNNFWPNDLKQHIDTSYKTPKSSTLEKWSIKQKFDSTVTAEEKLISYFGYHVIEEAKKSISFIDIKLTPYWIDPTDLKSGETPAGLLIGLRRSLYEDIALQKYKNMSKAAKSRKKGKDFDSTNSSKDETTYESVLKKITERDDEYHRTWLSFVILGVPAGDDSLKILQGGKILSKEFSDKYQTNSSCDHEFTNGNLSPLSIIRQKGGAYNKVTRKLIDCSSKTDIKKEIIDVSKTTPTTLTREIRIVHSKDSIQNNKSTNFNNRLNNLNNFITEIDELLQNPNIDEDYRNKLILKKLKIQKDRLDVREQYDEYLNNEI